MAKARRAKKSKVPKKLLIVPILLMGACGAAFGVNSEFKTRIGTTLESNIKSYDANDFVSDAFTQNDTKYLPIVYNDPYEHEQISKELIEQKFKEAGLTIESFSSDVIGTGTQIKTPNVTYTVIVYGDINGDGKVNARDVQCIVQDLCYGEGYRLTGIKKMAGNVENEKADIINVRDAQRIIKFILGKDKIIDYLPTSDILNDKEAPVITLNGEEEVTVKVFEEYIDQGATVTDNLDFNIGSKLVVEKNNVDTKKPGDYEVIYYAKDISGNETRATRKVHVVDYVSEIEIFTMPKTEYIEGEDITLDNMIAYAKMAYAGKQTKPISLEDISLSEDTPKVAELGMTEIKIVYKDVTKSIPIVVTEKRPVITLNYNDARDIKVKVGGDYEEGATAWDENDQKALNVTWDVDVDTSAPNKYTITYTSEPNSLGKVGTAKRTVEVIDYIKNIEFDIDRNKFKDTYVDGEKLSLDGVKVYATYAYDTEIIGNARKEITKDKLPSEITEFLKCDVTTILYDRKNSANNTDRTISVSCTVIDEIEGTSKVYDSKDVITINVVKQLETINKVNQSGVRSSGEMFEYVWIGRVTGGANEVGISVDNIECTVDKEDTSDGVTTRAWAVASNDDRYVDIYFVGVGENEEYTVTVKPKNVKDYTPATYTVTTTPSTIIDYMEVDGLKTEAGEAIKRFEAGTTIVADVRFYHVYGEEGKAGKHYVPMTKVLGSNLVGIEVQYNGNPLSNVTGQFLLADGTPVTADNNQYVVKKIKLDATKYTTNTKQDITLVVSIKNGADEYEYKYTYDKDMNRKITLCPKATNVLEVGEANKNPEPITLGFTETKKIKPYGGKYYTLLPIKLFDNYVDEDGYKEIFERDLSNDYTDIERGKIVFYDGIDEEGNISYIDVIGWIESGNKIIRAGADDSLDYVGIAIVDADSDVDESATLEGKNIDVYFEGNKVKTLGTISIQKASLSNIKYVDNVTNAISECFETKEVARVSSGDGQEALTSKDQVKLKVEKAILDSNGNITKTSALDKDTPYAASTAIDDKGIVTISFMAENEGDYAITPYIVVDNKERRLAPIVASIYENKEVTKVTFVDKQGNPLTDKNGQTLPQNDFGTLTVGVSTRNSVKFEHEYKDATGKLLGTKVVNSVDNSLVKISTKVGSKDYSNLITVNKMYGNGTIVEDDTETGININELRVWVSGEAKKGSVAYFNLTIKNEDGEDTYNKDIKVTFGDPATIAHVNVGSNNEGKYETIDLYLTTPPANRKDVKSYTKTIDGETQKLYYTLVPIKLVTSEGETVNSTELNMGNVTTSNEHQGVGKNGLIMFIDNVNGADKDYTGSEDDYNGYRGFVCIDVMGFRKNPMTGEIEPVDTVDNSGNVTDTDTNTTIDYIGIAIIPSMKDFLNENPPEGEEDYADVWKKLSTITVSYTTPDGVFREEERIFNINGITTERAD